MSEAAQTFVWLNGAMLPAASARIDPGDRGFTLGDGLFETIRVAGGMPRHAALHLARLRQGAAALGIEIALEDRALLAAFAQTLDANRFDDAAVLRLTLTRGAGQRGLAALGITRPTLLISASALAAAAPAITAVICRTTRRNEYSPLAAVKSLNYLDNIIARQEALARGAEDAILLNTQGNVAEATAASLFVLLNGDWLTPDMRDGALPGIFRGLVLARKFAREATLTEADLAAAQSIYLGNALGIQGVSSLDGQSLEIPPAALAALQAILDGG